MKHEEKLSEADRALAYALIAQIEASTEYGLACRWIQRAGLYRRNVWKTCSIYRVRLSMLHSTGIAVSEEAMSLALAYNGFSARPIDGEESTNVALRSLPWIGDQVDMYDRPGEVTRVRACEDDRL